MTKDKLTKEDREELGNTQFGLWLIGLVVIGILAGNLWEMAGFLIFLFVGVPVFWYLVVARMFGNSIPDLIVRTLVMVIFLVVGFMFFTVL